VTDKKMDLDKAGVAGAAGLVDAGPAGKALTPEAERALAEAAQRRRIRDQQDNDRRRELGGREGPDPVRYGDWENKGIVSDF